MKKILLHFAIVALPLFVAAGQADIAPAANSMASQSLMRQGPSTPPNTPNALFDLEFNYSLGRGGFAGITWLYSELWISKWQSDSLFTVDKATGAITSNFFIPGIDSVRGMTFDGTNVYMANNSDTIYKIDTLTKAIVSTIICPVLARGIAYDSANNALWIGNFQSDLVEIDMSGNVINQIFLGTHNLTGIYSIAYDPYTSGGPYIWASNQPTNPSQVLVRVPVATGIPDLSHNMALEMPVNGLAGGITITNWAPGPHSIVGICQTTPGRLFSYELSDYVPPAFDASADTLNFYPPTTMTPSFLITPISWEVQTTNLGANQIDTLGVDISVNDGPVNVYNANGYSLAVGPLTNSLVVVPGTFTPTVTPASYSVQALINLGTQSDVVATNDTQSYSFSITDTVMSRHGASSGRIGIGGGGTGGSIGIMYDIPITCYATSATFTLGFPAIGDSVYAELFDFNGVTPNALIARSAGHIITAADTGTAGVQLTLPFINSPIQMVPGSYIAAIHEHNSNVSLAYSKFNWRPNTSWIFLNSNSSWAPSETFAITNNKIVPFVDLNIWSQTMVSVPEFNNVQLSVYPNPASGELNIVNKNTDRCNFTITDIQGKVVYSKIFEGLQNETIRTSEWSNGVYVARVQNGGSSFVSKVVINH